MNGHVSRLFLFLESIYYVQYGFTKAEKYYLLIDLWCLLMESLFDA